MVPVITLPPPLDCADKALLVCAPTDSTRTGKFAPAGSTAPELPGLEDGVSAPAFPLVVGMVAECVLGWVARPGAVEAAPTGWEDRPCVVSVAVVWLGGTGCRETLVSLWLAMPDFADICSRADGFATGWLLANVCGY